MISCKAMTKVLYRNLECKKNIASNNIFRPFFCTNIFMFVLFLVQLEINLYLWFLPKSHYTHQRGSCNFSFLKNSLVQIPNGTWSRMITFTNSTAVSLCYQRQTGRQTEGTGGRQSEHFKSSAGFFFFFFAKCHHFTHANTVNILITILSPKRKIWKQDQSYKHRKLSDKTSPQPVFLSMNQVNQWLNAGKCRNVNHKSTEHKDFSLQGSTSVQLT